jgi:MFS family permease
MGTAPQPYQTFSHRRALRAGLASFVGTAIEFYDFYVFAFAAAIVFGPLFFPEADPVTGIIASFAVYAVGFFCRPLGSIIFGHIGDRLGRRVSLVLTLIIMGAGTTLVGVLPTYASVGIWAPILLLALRILQGIAVGGEWGGAVAMAVEYAPNRFKGLYGAFPQLGNPGGALLASGIFALLTMNGSQFLESGGWRIPFLLSAVLIGVGFWVRYHVEETPVFEAETAEEVKREIPLKTAIVNNWRALLLGIGLIPVSTGGYYIVTTFATAYGTDASFGIGISENMMLSVLTIASFFEFVATLLIGAFSDRTGRKTMMQSCLVLSAILIIPMFLTMGPNNFVLMVVLFTAVRVAMSGTWAPVASIMAQMFRPRARQTSISIAYSVGVAIWAGLSPVTATALYAATGSIWGSLGLYFGMTALSIICLFLAPQYNDGIFEEDAVGAGAATTKTVTVP